MSTNERDELAEVIANFRDDWYKTDRKAPAGIDRDEAAHLLAAGYRKREVVIEWGAAFAETGAFYKSYSSLDEAQAFVDGMGEVGAEMVVMTREVLPQDASDWRVAS